MRDEFLELFKAKYDSIVTHRLNSRTGKQFKVGAWEFSTPREAHQLITKLGIRRVDVFRPGMSAAVSPQVGPQFYGFLEDLSKRTGLSIFMSSHHIENERMAEALKAQLTDPSGNQYGYLLADRDSTRVLQFRAPNNKLLTNTQILEKLGTDIDFEALASGKTAKRWRSLVSIRKSSAMFDRAINVAVEDPRSLLQPGANMAMSDEAARAAFDGLSLASPHLLKETADEIERRAARFEQESFGSNSADAIRLRDQAKAMRREAEELKSIASRGGRFNFRGMGSMKLVSGSLQKKLGQIKGDALVPSFQNWKHGREVDVVTTAANINEEVRFGGRSFVSWEERTIKPYSFLDIQSFTANPDLYDVDKMESYTRQWVKKEMDRIERTGQPSPGFVKHLRKIMARFPEENLSADEVIHLRKQQTYARNILNHLDAGLTLSTDPAMMRMAMKSIKGFIRGENDIKKKVPHFLVPQTLSAEVANYSMVKDAGSKMGAIPRGYIDFDPTFGWVLNDEDVLHFHKAFGGFDLDDLLQNAVRGSNGEVIVFGKRSPTALSENAVFRMKANSPAIRQLMEFDDPDTFRPLYQRVDALTAELSRLMSSSTVNRAAISRLQKELNAAQKHVRSKSLSRLSQTTPEFIDEMKLRGVNPPVPDDPFWRMHPELSPDGSNWKALPSFMKEYRPRTDRVQGKILEALDDMTSQYTITQQFEELDRITKTKYHLETWAKTRMVVDSLRHTNSAAALESYANMGGFIHIIENEQTIDALVNAGSRDLDRYDRTLMQMAQDTQVELGRALAHGLSVDPELLKRNEWERQFIERGIKSVNPELTLDDILSRQTVVHNFYSYAMQRFGTMYEDIEADAAMIRKRTKYIPEIMEEAFTAQERADARLIFDTYSTARAKYSSATLDSATWADMIDELGSPIDVRDTEKMVAEDVRNAVYSLFEDNQMGTRARRAIGAALQMSADSDALHSLFMSPEGGENSLMDMRSHVISWFLTKGGDESVIQGLDLPDEAREIQRVMSRRSFTTAGGVAEAARAALDQHIPLPTNEMKMISLDKARALWHGNPSLRTAALIGGGLMLFGEIYRAVTERNHENMEGPPLLPGGSAYEDMIMPDMPDGWEYQPPSSTGTMYRVRVRGNVDPHEFQRQAEGITGAPAAGTIYNTLENSYTDVWQAIGEDFV